MSNRHRLGQLQSSRSPTPTSRPTAAESQTPETQPAFLPENPTSETPDTEHQVPSSAVQPLGQPIELPRLVAEVPAQPAQPPMQSLLFRLLNQARTGAQSFYLVVLPEDGLPRIEYFNVIEDLVARMRELVGQPCAVFAFLGYYMPITRGQFRYLQTPFGEMLPLFTVPQPGAVEIEATGWLGSDEPGLPEPQLPQSADPQALLGTPETNDETAVWETPGR